MIPTTLTWDSITRDVVLTLHAAGIRIGALRYLRALYGIDLPRARELLDAILRSAE